MFVKRICVIFLHKENNVIKSKIQITQNISKAHQMFFNLNAWRKILDGKRFFLSKKIKSQNKQVMFKA